MSNIKQTAVGELKRKAEIAPDDSVQTERAKTDTVSSKLSLTADPTGRTSCATTEDEHYRLRCLGLLKVARATRADATTKRARVRDLQTWLARP
jgi:hypothetical protein